MCGGKRAEPVTDQTALVEDAYLRMAGILAYDLANTLNVGAVILDRALYLLNFASQTAGAFLVSLICCLRVSRCMWVAWDLAM